LRNFGQISFTYFKLYSLRNEAQQARLVQRVSNIRRTKDQGSRCKHIFLTASRENGTQFRIQILMYKKQTKRCLLPWNLSHQAGGNWQRIRMWRWCVASRARQYTKLHSDILLMNVKHYITHITVNHCLPCTHWTLLVLLCWTQCMVTRL